MTYIFLVAGKGTRLQPLTLKYPKTLYKLDKDITVLQRMVSLIKKYDPHAEIVAVTGFMKDIIEESISGVKFVYNPFYSVTNSIASLWFAREYLDRDNVTLINGDIVMSDDLIRDVLCKKADKPFVLLDASIKIDGDYNVQVEGDKVVVMSKGLDVYCGEYAGVAKLDKDSLGLYKKEVESMVEHELFDQWYEDALVEMIFKYNFVVYYEDISNYEWTEIDCVSDLVLAKKIQSASNYYMNKQD